MSLANTSSLKKTSASGTTDSPYLGSKISLVSKAKIRYEGILYTIDANESTVALSKVRSFGTEDRPTDRPVPARDEIFEYIIFRGADIEDLQVREPPQSSLTQDPAIVESSAYPDNNRSNTIGTNTSLTSLTQTGPTRSLSNRGTMPSPPAQQATGKGPKSSDPLRQLNFNQQRSTRSFNQQSPLMQYDGQDYGYGNSRRHRPTHDYYPMNRRTSHHYGYAEWSRPSQRYNRPMPVYENNRFYSTRRQQNGGNFYGPQRQRRHSTGALNNNQSSSRKTDRTQSTRSNGNGRSTLKFVGDFDFEKSNAEFDKNAIEDEIKKSLSLKTSKIDLNSESTTIPEHETETETEKEKEKEKEKEIEKENHALTSECGTTPLDGYYDKQKSFFDRISCEANEKEKTNKRRNWNEERRMNAETFGLKYRPVQQHNNQRSSSRRNPARYQRPGNARNTMYYGNFSNRVRAY